jgi:hypothetical protein
MPLLHGWPTPTNNDEKARSAIFAQTGPSSTLFPDFPVFHHGFRRLQPTCRRFCGQLFVKLQQSFRAWSKTGVWTPLMHWQLLSSP